LAADEIAAGGMMLLVGNRVLAGRTTATAAAKPGVVEFTDSLWVADARVAAPPCTVFAGETAKIRVTAVADPAGRSGTWPTGRNQPQACSASLGLFILVKLPGQQRG
jgi:hypothetical protein